MCIFDEEVKNSILFPSHIVDPLFIIRKVFHLLSTIIDFICAFHLSSKINKWDS